MDEIDVPLRKLAAEWERRGRKASPFGDDATHQEGLTLRRCARELRAALHGAGTKEKHD